MLLLSFIFYRHAIVELPRHDQAIFFIPEFAKKDFSFKNIEKSLFYSKLREKGPGDYFLFRPLMTFSLFVLDYLYREDLVVIGLISLFLHTFCCFLIYLIGRQYLPALLAVFLSLLGIAEFPGLEALYFRHILPYLMGFIIWLGALYVYGEKTKSKYLKVGLLLFIASLFHEAFAVTYIAMLAFSIKDKKERLLFASIGLLYLSCYFLDWYLHRPPSFWGNKDSQDLGLLNAIIMISKNFQHHLVAWIAPYLVYFTLYEKTGKWLANYPLDQYSFLNILLLIGFLGGLGFYYFKIKEKTVRNLFLMNLGYIFSIIIFMSIGRGMQRGDIYLNASSYYSYYTFFSFLFLVILILKDIQLETFLKSRVFQIAVGYGFVCIVLNYVFIQNFFVKNSNVTMSAANIVYEIKQRIENKPFCIDSYSQPLAQLQLPVLLSGFDCSVNEKPNSLQILLNQDLSVSMVELNSKDKKVVILENHLRP